VKGLIFLSVGIELVILTVAGAFAGRYLDGVWDTSPWMLVSGLMLGAALGLFHLVRLAGRVN
jgi:F0F1-type ATP synthase assembly protein I